MSFSKDLLRWFDTHHRKLPWREAYLPYTVWISEIMLQQTQVVTVVDYFNRFVKRFPTVSDLASADEDEVFKIWEGLGYYSRARNLHRCAKTVMEKYSGEFPVTKKALEDLPGIGPYTAGAISSIAYNQFEAAVDGNVMRVMSRIYASDLDVSDAKSRVQFENMVLSLMEERPRFFNQALMELGAVICTPRSPNCSLCPVKVHCKAEVMNIQTTLPVKSKKISKKHLHAYMLVLNSNQKILFEKRNEPGLMQALWGLPCLTVEMDVSEAEILSYVEETYGLQASIEKRLDGKKHVFTHLVWDIELVFLKVREINSIDWPEVIWIELDDTDTLAIGTAFKKQLSLIKLEE